MMRGACSEPHKRGSAKTCAEHMHRRLLQTAFWPLAELSQRVPNNIQSRTNAQSSVSPTSLQMQCKLHLQKQGWYKKQSPALGICLHPLQLDCKAHVLKPLSRHDYWLRQFSVDFAQKTLQRQIRMQVVFLATLRAGIYKMCFYCKLKLTCSG